MHVESRTCSTASLPGELVFTLPAGSILLEVLNQGNDLTFFFGISESTLTARIRVVGVPEHTPVEGRYVNLAWAGHGILFFFELG